HSSAAEARDQAGRTEGIEQPYRLYVERQLQGLAQRHRSLMGGFEVAWSVTGKARRAVLDQGFRIGDARFEGKGIDQRLQGRAGRPRRRHRVTVTATLSGK